VYQFYWLMGKLQTEGGLESYHAGGPAGPEPGEKYRGESKRLLQGSFLRVCIFPDSETDVSIEQFPETISTGEGFLSSFLTGS
jgi:hypothetical protein